MGDLAFTAFGFCEFDDAQSVLRALRLLPKIPIKGKPLLVRPPVMRLRITLCGADPNQFTRRATVYAQIRVDENTRKFLDYEIEMAGGARPVRP